MIDHTFMFPKMIWFFASIVLLFFRYSLVVLLASYVLIYFLYVIVEIFNYICVRSLLKPFADEHHFYSHLWWIIFTLPGYNLVCFWIRLVGTINMMTRPLDWNGERLATEISSIRQQVRTDWQQFRHRHK